MNLPQFLNRVDTEASNMSQEQLVILLHDLARTLPENRRECAAFVAAFGEVKESRGERNGKDNIFEAYRTEYSRRSAFHNEMRAFGMKDRKRK